MTEKLFNSVRLNSNQIFEVQAKSKSQLYLKHAQKPKQNADYAIRKKN